MYLGSACKVGAVLGIVTVEVRCMLEIVSIELAVGQRLVRQNIIVVYLDIEGVALFFKYGLDVFEYLAVRCGSRTDDDGLVGGSFGSALACLALGR